jgi:hypothetical protein
MEKIKLRPKQLSLLQSSQAKKAELNKQIQDLTASENIIVELVLEEAGVKDQVTQLKLEGDELQYEIVKQTPKPKGKGTKKTAMQVVEEE